MSKLLIDSKGYGKIYKAVTRNPRLPLLAKAIYAYLCAYAGNGSTAFPSRDKMTRDLQMNKDTCTKHISALVTQGYLSKQRTTINNLYTIVQEVSIENKNYDDIESNSDLLIFNNIGSRGFGTVPKLAMLDKRLTAQAKGIYAYFCSFAGAGDTAFPRRSTILRELKISEPTYYKHYNLLTEYGYITSEQKTINGRYRVSVYELQAELDMPPNDSHYKAMSEKLGYDNSDVENSEEREVSTSEKVMSENLMSGKVMSEKTVHSNFGHTNNNNIPYNKQGNNKQLHNNQSYNQIKAERCGKPTPAQIKKWISYEQHLLDMEASPALRKLLGRSDNGMDDLQYISKYRQILKALPVCIAEVIDRFDLCGKFGKEVLKEIFDYNSIREIIDRIMDRYDEINRPKAYLETALSNYIKTLLP